MALLTLTPAKAKCCEAQISTLMRLYQDTYKIPQCLLWGGIKEGQVGTPFPQASDEALLHSLQCQGTLCGELELIPLPSPSVKRGLSLSRVSGGQMENLGCYFHVAVVIWCTFFLCRSGVQKKSVKIEIINKIQIP